MLRNLGRLASIRWRCAAPIVEKPQSFHLKLAQSSELNFVRYKYVTSGIQGRREIKLKPIKHDDEDDVDDFENTQELLRNE